MCLARTCARPCTGCDVKEAYNTLVRAMSGAQAGMEHRPDGVDVRATLLTVFHTLCTALEKQN